MTLPEFLAFVVVPCWFLYRLIRNPQSRALRAVVACLILHSADSPTIMSWLRELFELSPSVEKLVKNYALGTSWFCLMLFFLFAAHGRKRRAWRETAILVGVLTTLTLAVLLTPNADQVYPTSPTLAAARFPAVRVFYVVGNAYFAYATGAAAVWAVRYARESPQRTRFGLRLAAVGLGAFATLSAVRAVLIMLPHLPAASRVTNQLTGPALWLFVIGVCVAGAMARIAAGRIWWQHRSAYHQLRPLWTAMHDVFPADQLDRHSLPPGADRLSPWRIHRRYWRRIVEIRDGLVQLSPHLRDLGYTPDARLTADQLRGALDRQRTGVAPSSRHATLVAAPDTGGAEADVDELLRLSRALQQDSPCNDS